MQYLSQYPVCYQNFITSLQGCNGVASTSGLYFENLEGISIQLAANVADSRYQSGLSLLNDKAIFAIRNLEQELQAAMLRFGYYIEEYQDINEFCGFSTQTVTTSATAKGLQIARFSSITPNSEFYIENIYIKTVLASAIVVSLYDQNGNLIESFNITTLADQVTILAIKKAYQYNTIRVVIDTPNIEVYLANCCFFGDTLNCCTQTVSDCNCANNYEILGDCCKRKTFSINGWDGVRKSSASYGIALRGGMRCALSAVMCQILPMVKMAVLYRAGVEVLNELIASTRLNFVTVYSAEWAAAKSVEWLKTSNQMFHNTIDAALPNLLKNEAFCIKCHERNKPKKMSSV